MEIGWCEEHRKVWVHGTTMTGRVGKDSMKGQSKIRKYNQLELVSGGQNTDRGCTRDLRQENEMHC